MSSSRGCGIDWNIPDNHFDGINEQGELSYWRELGQVDFGGGFKVPLVIGFKPSRGACSWLGRGWIIPLLESNIVQIDDKRFLLTQPDGITRQFWRRTPSDSVLLGQGSWKGEIRDKSITLWAECGWKLQFNKGRIATITSPANRVLNVLYSNNRATEIQSQGRTLLRVECDPGGERMKALSFGDKRVEVEYGGKPRVEVVEGRKLVGGIEIAPAKLTFNGGVSVNFSFGVDEQMQPTLNVSGDQPRSFTWDPANGRLLRDGQWTYEIKPGRDLWENAAIHRANAKGQGESWYYDHGKGVETSEGINGIKTVKKRFIAGPLAGRIRQVEEVRDGRSTLVESNAYDQDGRVIRRFSNGLTEQRTYEGNTLVRAVVSRDNQAVAAYEYDANGQLISQR